MAVILLFRPALFALVSALVLIFSGPALADCVNPPAKEKKIVYRSDLKLFQYCDGTDWRAMLSGRNTNAASDLPGLTDVADALAPADGDVLTYLSSSAEWIAAPGGIGAESDPQVNTLTGSKWCAANAGGTAIDCTQNAPTGDNLGDHVADQNILLGTHWLSGDGGDEGIYIDSDGHVGIGTTAPSSRLTVDGLGAVSFELRESTSDLVSLLFAPQSAAEAVLRYEGRDSYLAVSGATAGFQFGYLPLGNIGDANRWAEITDNGAAFMSGNVGIGDTNPQARLHVDGTVRFEDFLTCTALETDGSGNLVCGSDDGLASETDPQVGTLTANLFCQANAGATAVDCNDSAATMRTNLGLGAVALLAAETDPQVGAVTNLNYCRGDGSAAQCNRTITNVRDDIKTVDGSGSGLDADTLDSLDSTQFLRSDTGDTIDVGRGAVYIENNANDNADGAGLTLRAASNPTNGSIFAVRSSGQALGLWVGQSMAGTGRSDFRVSLANDGTGGYSVWHSNNDGSGSGLDADTIDGLNSTAFLQSESDPQVGTLTGSSFCQANAGGTAVDCNDSAATMRTNLGLGAVALLAAETDPQVGTLTAGQWCKANAGGTAVTCNQNPPAASPSCVRRTATAATTAAVSCNVGEVMTGGGCDNSDSGNNVKYSYPSADGTWACSLSGGSATAYAICCSF